jgi:hypothetical protein
MVYEQNCSRNSVRVALKFIILWLFKSLAACELSFGDLPFFCVVLEGMFRMATAEKGIQAGVSVVKNTIVVRSIIIPMANLASNFMQLSMHGVSIRDMYQGYQTKLLEITKYQKNLKRKVDIEAEITAQRTNPDAVRRLETELKSLEDANRRMSIWPLMEAGSSQRSPRV